MSNSSRRAPAVRPGALRFPLCSIRDHQGVHGACGISRCFAAATGRARVRASVEVETGRRKVVEVRQHTIVCFQVTLRGLLEEESILVQTQGVGGRRHLGSGLFIPNPCAALQRAGAKA